jgi:putative transposase
MSNFTLVVMKKSKFTESQITQALKEHEAGKNVLDICRELKINRQTFYNWKKKYSGMDAELLRRFKELERENAEFKRMYADLSLDHRILKQVIEKKL